jgi:Protein of unknown function (DUF2281)
MMNTRLIEQKFNVLPDDLKREVLNFIDFLMAKRRQEKMSGQFDFTWEGGLKKMKGNFNSVDLQHKSMEWR